MCRGHARSRNNKKQDLDCPCWCPRSHVPRTLALIRFYVVDPCILWGAGFSGISTFWWLAIVLNICLISMQTPGLQSGGSCLLFPADTQAPPVPPLNCRKVRLIRLSPAAIQQSDSRSGYDCHRERIAKSHGDNSLRSPFKIAKLPTPLEVSLLLPRPLTSETLNPVICGKSAVPSAQEKPMVLCATRWIRGRPGCLILNWEGRETVWMSSRHGSKNGVETRKGKGKLMLPARHNQRDGGCDLVSKREVVWHNFHCGILLYSRHCVSPSQHPVPHHLTR